MTLRLVQVLVPASLRSEVQDLLDGADVLAHWQEPALEGQTSVRILVEAERTQPVLDALEQRFASADVFRVVLLPVEATIPRPPVDREGPSIGREELLADLSGGTRISRVYLLTVLLSAVVASLGLMRDNVAVIIGAMVIAPLLAPNMALALATTLGDLVLMKKALRTNAVGVAAAFAVAVACGAILPFDTGQREIVSRTHVSYADIALALASGTAGALAFVRGVPTALVGVMVAVALLPPLAVAGLLLATGEAARSLQALLLLAANVICVNLAAVVTFLASGVRPRTWWEADKARRAARRAVLLWGALLVLLAALIWLARS